MPHIPLTEDELKAFERKVEILIDLVAWAMDFRRDHPDIELLVQFTDVLGTLFMAGVNYSEGIEKESLKKMFEMAGEIRKEIIKKMPREFLEMCDELNLKYPTWKKH